jgi:hypothetical protein
VNIGRDQDDRRRRPTPAQLSPPYGGSPIPGVEVDGFRLGEVTDFTSEPTTSGDAFVEAPHGTRAGLVWETGVEERYFAEVLPPDRFRWGVFSIATPTPRALGPSAEVLREFLQDVLNDLAPIWEAWAASYDERFPPFDAS